MRVIGVIDLMRGRAVHGRAGRRNQYRDVTTAAGVRIDGDAIALARSYMERLGISDIYIADLDAIESGAPQDDVVSRIAEHGARLLVDGGVRTVDDARRVAAVGPQTVVVGLETLESFDLLSEIRAAIPQQAVAFSLDLREGAPLATRLAVSGQSPEDIAREAVASHIDAVIVLDVARVGMGGGPDFEMMRRIRAAIPGLSLLAGGGVRDLDDLRRLSDMGCDGALVATALHDGRLTARDVNDARAF